MTLELRDLNSIANQFAEALRQSFSTDSATGTLANNIRSIVEFDGKYFTIALDTVDYFKYANDGRKAGKFPPLEDIKRWIRVKSILPTPIKGKLPTENQLAYLIGRKIALRGTQGSHLLEKTEGSFQIERKVINALYDEIDKVIDKIIDDEIYK
nr:hypothetical protein ELOWGMBK_ELOWGMBK_CDS_0003 [Herelleviridae sp.]CAI9751926.1 hypothetical protein QGKEIAJE_QGKEIAJE_CDS_0003 [uncultured phage]